jgi:hypothetical protein
MICPNKLCKQEIPDDSCFCDQCGVQLFRCSKCGFIGTGKYCGTCGGALSAVEPPHPDDSPETPPPEQAAIPVQEPAPALVQQAPSQATVIISLPADKLVLRNPEGWKIALEKDDILGRTNGRHTAHLGKYQVISSRHAGITRENNEWFITDLGSTNGSYVNGVKLQPNVPVKIKQDDVIVLANVTFTVVES